MTLKIFRLTCVCLMSAAGFVSAVTAQTESNNADRPARAQTVRGTAQSSVAADEDFEVNIGERHITEAEYEASVSVAVGEESARGLNLRVGVAVGASHIDVLLRNVRGRVRFRATLEQILRRLDERRTVGAPAASAPQPGSPSP